MDVIQNVFERAESGDRIMISFPDMVSFYTVIRWLTAHYGEPLWILWTDAAVERINFLGKKFGYPLNGKAVLVGARKECDFLDVIAKYELYDDLGSIVKMAPIGEPLIISFGVNFIKYFGERISKAVEMIIEHENGILCTCVIGEPPEELLPFHDTIIEVKPGEDSYLTYRSYIAKLRFAIDGGTVEISDTFLIKEE